MSKNVVDMTLRANMDLSQVSSGLNQMQGILKQLKLSPTLKKEFDSLFSTAVADLEKYQAKLQSGFKTKGDITGFEKIAQSLQGSLSSLEKEWSKLQAMDLGEITRLDSNTINQIKQIEETFKRITSELQTRLTPQIEQVGKSIAKLTTTSSKNAGKEILDKLNAGQIKEAEKALDSYIAKQEKALQTFGKKKGVLEDGTPEYDLDDSRTKSLANTLNIYNEIKKQIDNMTSSLSGYNQEASKLKTDKLTIMAEATDKTNQKLQQGSTIISGVTQKTQEYSRAVLESGKKTVELGNDIDMLKNRVSHFFSLTNSVMLFRRILQDTIQTTKELDAAMTETAVVTDFSVADMWKELPRYTEAAKELGATIQGVYETTTLYYQQGLKTNEVFEVGTETLKMAKIAGLDYAQATDFMTAALRGFNMEVNELNAQKVNDVYSELAAITAADTQEIATAMTKTASIASSANMEFETTAAFLSQIIETTRESAETAGTALKTVIARFTELKKDPAEIGEVDGEIVDANKIETALRTIDVALRDTSGQFRDLDEVFLDIAEKWDGLDTNTQRYIATMAAGSRQQSRFIAMMSDYDRTMQLVSAANNSAGASQKQFDKTLESLEAKLNKLGAAWDQFTMGIANNTLIKAGVDALTGLLNIINKITEHLPGATKGIGNLLLMIGGFTAGKKVMDAFFASTVSNIANLGKAGEKGGAAYGITFREALNKEFGKTKNLFSKNNLFGSFSGDLTKHRKKIIQEIADIDKEVSGLSETMEKLDAKQPKFSLEEDLKLFDNASIAQKQTYLALLDEEYDRDILLKALTGELNDEKYREIAIDTLLAGTNKTANELTEEEIKDRIALMKTKAAEKTVDQMGILTKAKEITLLFLGSPARKKEAQERLVAAGATWAQKVAIDGLNLSLGMNIALLTGGIALIAGLVIGLVMMAKAAKENSLEYKMEKAAEATEKAKEAAEQAKQAYDDLNSSIESINNKEDAFENLTYGTLEWQKALLEVNQEIMDLINQFPGLKDQLLNELTVEASGKLTLSTDGYNMIKEQSLQYYKNAIAGQMMSSSQEAELQNEKARLDFYKTAIHALDETGERIENTKIEQIGGKLAQNQLITEYSTDNSFVGTGGTLDILAYLFGGDNVRNAIADSSTQQREFYENSISEAGLSTEQYKSLNVGGNVKDIIYEKFLESPEIFTNVNDDLVAFASSLEEVNGAAKISAESLLDFTPVLRQRQLDDLERQATLRAQGQNLLLSTTSNDFQFRDNKNELTDTFSQFYVDQQKDDVQAELVKMNDLKNIADYASELGLTNFFDQGSELENLRKMYQELTGFSKDKVEEMFGESTDALKTAIASIKVGKDWGSRVENFAKELDAFVKKLPEGSKLALEQLFGGADGTGFTKQGIEEFNKLINSTDENGNNDLEKFFNENETIKQQFVDEYGADEAYAKFEEWATKMVNLGTDAFFVAEERLKSLGFEVENFGSTLDSGAVSALSKKIEDVYYKTGEDGADAIMTGYNDIIKSFNGNETLIKNFTSALLALDWSSASDIKTFKDNLKELGIVLDNETIDTFTSDLIKFNEASSAVKLENLTQEIEKLDALASSLENREYNDFKFTREEKDELVAAGVSEDDFAGYGDNWQYLDNSVRKLIDAVNANTEALIGDTLGELEKQRDTAMFLDDKNTNVGELANYSYQNEQQRIDLLASLLNQVDKYNEGKNPEDQLTQFGGFGIDQLKQMLFDENGETKKLDQFQVDKLNQVLEALASLLGQSNILDNQVDQVNQDNAVRQYATGPYGEMVHDATQTPNGENEQQINAATEALLNQAKQYDELTDEVKEYKEAVAAGNNEVAEQIKKQIAAGTAIAEAARNISKYSGEIEDAIDSLDDLDSESVGYEETLENIASLMGEMFESDFDVELISGENIENLYLFQDALAGNQTAWEQFIKNIAIARLETSDFAQQFNLDAQQISGIAAALDAIEFDVNGTADMTDVINELINCGATTEMIATFIELLSQSSIEFDVEMVDYTMPDGTVIQIPASFQATSSYIPAANYGNFGGSGGSSGGGGGGGGGSDSGSEEEEPWENSFDKFYNLTEDINELLDKRNELETEYDLILQNQNATINDYLKSYTDRIKSFKEEIALQEEMLRLRQQDQDDILSEYSHLSEYAWVEDGAVYIDYDAIDQVEDQELGAEIEEFVSKLEENDEAIQEASDAVQENTLAIEELMDDWRDATADFEERVFDAIVEEREKEIERLEEAAQTLDDSNSELVDAIQKEIDERRRQRENEETEKDLAEKERRLAYLQQDTSGAYDTEILQLEKDLKQQKEDYTYTLIDQKISELQEQNDEAAKQREKQIQIMQYQLKNDQETGAIAAQVSKMLQEANSDEGWARVWKLLEKSEGFKGLTDTNKAVWEEDTQREFKEAMSYLNGLHGGGIAEALEGIATINADYYASLASSYDASASSYEDSTSTYSQSSSTPSTTTTNTMQVSQVEKDAKGIEYYKIGGKWYKASDTSGLSNGSTTLKSGATPISGSLMAVGGKLSGQKNLADGATSAEAISDAVALGSTEKINGVEYFKYGSDYYYKADIKTYKGGHGDYISYIAASTTYFKKYKTGGLADYTGPAWLDGTKSKPELVLNQKETQNFLQLKDVLSSFMKQGTNMFDNSSSNGDTIYDISISVESIANDYDVDQVANRVKQIISSDAAYRNSTMIQRLR